MRERIKRKEIPVVKLGGRLLIMHDDLENYLNEHRDQKEAGDGKHLDK